MTYMFIMWCEGSITSYILINIQFLLFGKNFYKIFYFIFCSPLPRLFGRIRVILGLGERAGINGGVNSPKHRDLN